MGLEAKEKKEKGGEELESGPEVDTEVQENKQRSAGQRSRAAGVHGGHEIKKSRRRESIER